MYIFLLSYFSCISWPVHGLHNCGITNDHCTYITLRGAFIVHLSIFILHSVVPETQCSSPRLEGSLYCISMFLVPEAQWSSHHLERGLYCISRYVCSTRSLTDQRSCKTLDADFWANILTWYWLNCWTESTTEVGPEWVNLIQSAMERPHSGPTAVVTAVQPSCHISVRSKLNSLTQSDSFPIESFLYSRWQSGSKLLVWSSLAYT